MPIEKIISKKEGVVSKSNNSKGTLVTTATNKAVFVPEASYVREDTHVNYEPRKQGETYQNSDGSTGTYKRDFNQFQGSSKDTSEEKLRILDYLVAKGITPTFQL